MNTGDLCYSTDGETFDYSEPDLNIGDTYYSGKVLEISPSELVHKWCVDNIIEQMEEQLYERVGEAADDNFSISDKAKGELHSYIKEFMNKNSRVTCYQVTDIQEHICDE